VSVVVGLATTTMKCELHPGTASDQTQKKGALRKKRFINGGEGEGGWEKIAGRHRPGTIQVWSSRKTREKLGGRRKDERKKQPH